VSSSCIFCKIAAGEIPGRGGQARRRHAGVQGPQSAGATHLLVIPTTHVGTLNDAKDGATLGKLLLFARDVAQETGIASRGYRVVVNTNPDGGQTVFHLHLHVLGGRVMHWPPG